MLRRTAAAWCASPVRAQPLIYRAAWGVNTLHGLDGADNVRNAIYDATHDAATGRRQFDGIEFCSGVYYPFIGEDASLVAALQQLELKAIVQVHTCGYPVPAAFPLHHPKAAGHMSGRQLLQPAWKEHVDSLRFHCEDMARRLTPSSVESSSAAAPKRRGHPVIAAFNCHGGKDSMPREDALRFLEAACAVERDVGIPICHETHRQRLFHSPFVLQALRADLPATLKLNADLSHFVVGLERLMCDENDAEFWPEILNEVLARRSLMMHCRVGLPQSPQLPDPRRLLATGGAGEQGRGTEGPEPQPEHRLAFDRHVAWWKTIANGMRERGVPVTCVPEYGPPPYQTVGDAAMLDSICRTAAEHLRQNL